MDDRLKRALERRGLPVGADDRTTQDFYARLPLAEKAKIGEEVGREASGEPLQVREAERRDIVTRTFHVRAATVNEDERSVEAVISTESPVEVWDWRRGETIDEVLLGDAAQMPAQMPLLANHSRWSLDDVLGSIRSLRLDGGTMVGRLHFAGDETAERAWQKVRGGHITDVSVGYRVQEATEIAPGQTATVRGKQYTAGKRTLRVATAWSPKEGSLVPIGADQAAKIRDDGQPIDSRKENYMDPKLRKYLESIGLRKEATEAEAQAFHQQLTAEQRSAADAAVKAAPPASPPASPPANPPARGREEAGNSDPGTAASAAIAAERNRVRSIRQLAGTDVPAEIRDRAIDEGWDLARANAEFLAAIRVGRQPGQNPPPVYQPSAHTGPMGGASVRSLAAGMMLGYGIGDPTRHAMHNGRRDPSAADRLSAQDAEQGQRFQRLSLADVIRMAVQMDTGRMHWDVGEALEAARSSPSGGTLSYVFSTNVYARLIAGWETVGDTTVGWCEEEDVPNFLQQEDISLAASARLQQLPRGDTAKHATMSDSHETYKIARYAKQFVVDEQDVIDDRLGAILRMPAEMGEAARQLRPDLVYSLLLENPTMVADSGAAFNATAVTTSGGHANLGTAALASGALKTAIGAMVKQRLNRTASDPGRALTLRPKFLIVPADLEWGARELTSAAALAKLFADTSDPWYAALNLLAQEGLRVIPDDRIGAIGVLDPRTGTARTGLDTNWFLTTGRGLRVAYRRGTNRQPQMRSFLLDKGQWGMGWDINLDIGGAFVEWRTWYKSTGAA